MSATLPDRMKSPGIKILVIVALLLVLFGIVVTVMANSPSYPVRPGIRPDIVADIARRKVGDTDDADNGIWIITSSVTKDPSTASVIETTEREIDEHGNIIRKTTETMPEAISDSPDQPSVIRRVTYEYNKDGYKETERTEYLNETKDPDESNHRRIEFDADGRLIVAIEGGNKTTYTYDWRTGELRSMSSKMEGAFDASASIGYRNGLITGTSSAWGFCDTTYEYDDAGHLTSSRTESRRSPMPSEEPEVTSCEYEVDENGNISGKTSQVTGYQTSYEYAYVPNPSKGAILYAQIENAASYDE